MRVLSLCRSPGSPGETGTGTAWGLGSTAAGRGVARGLLRPMNRISMLRRLIALIVLLAVTVSTAETVYGVARDSSLHQDGVAAVVSVAAAAAVHDHADPPTDGPEKRRSSSHDHCTHQHGTPLVAPRFIFAVVSPSLYRSFPEPTPWAERGPEPLFHPPQA